MGILDNLKDFYYSLEDGYYRVLDKVNNVLPVYKIIDPIDSVLPSFLLLLLLLVFGIGAFVALGPGGGLMPPGAGEKATWTLQALDASGKPLSGAMVSLTTDTEDFTLATDAGGKLSIDLPRGAQVSLIVTKDGYEGQSKSFVFGADTAELTLRLQEKTPGGGPPSAAQLAAKTIDFVDQGGKKITKQLSVQLSCSNLGISFLQDTYNISTGSLTYFPPENCGKVMVKVDGQGINDVLVDDDSGIMRLQEAQVREGGILVRLNPTLDGAKVELRDAVGTYVDEGFSSYGEKTFKAQPGTYYVTVTDTGGSYAGAQSAQFVVYADQTKTVEVALSREIQAVLNVKVLDKLSGAAVTGAKVTLKRETGEAMGTQTLEAGKAAITFNLEEKGKYFVEAYHDNYLSSTDVAVDASTASKTQPLTIEVRLEKLTADNSGRVEVTVLDEENLPVDNAKVSLYYAQTKFLCEACGSVATDNKGMARFKGLKGKVYAYAQKYPSIGKSEEKELDVKLLNALTIKMKIGFGTLKVHARDADGAGVPFADIEVFNAAGTKLGTISADDKGDAVYQAKADKAIYVRVSKSGMTTWTSRLEQIFPDQTIEFNASLLARIVGKEPKVLFDGLFDKGTTKVASLAPGERYKARFSIQVPSESTLRNLTFFLRTGTENAVEKDPWFVNALNIPTAVLIKGTTWNPPMGNDEQLLTNGDAKWAKVSWVKDSGIEPGIYNVEVELKVRQETQLGTALALSYRLQAEEITGKFLRDPVDTTIGDRQNSPTKKELYANTYDKSFATGQAESCASGFCYGERMYDPIDKVYLKSPYQLRVFQKYRLETSLTNDSTTVHDNANLRVKMTLDGLKVDDSVVINKYSLVNADATTLGETGQKYELPPLGLGRFSQNKTLRGEYELEARKVGTTNLQQVMISSGNEAFNKLTPLTIFLDQRLKIDLDQDVIPAYVETRLVVHITYESGDNAGFDTDNALVRLRRRTPDLVETVQAKVTGQTGKVEFIVPASSPGTKLTLEVEKRGYAGEAVGLQVSDKPVEMSPATLTYTLGLTTNNERDAPLTITSKIPQKLYISKLMLRGDKFRGLLDQQKMQNFLNQYTVQPFWIEEGKPATLNVKAAVSALAKLLKEKASVDGSLVVELSNESRTASYVYSVPLKADIGLAEKPKVSGCLSVQPNAWRDTTFDAKLVKGITVKNNCITASGQPMDLSNLSAMMVWSGEIVGYVEITLNDTAAGAAPTILLQTNRPSQLFETVQADKEYTGTLTFTPLPDPSVLGKTAKFSVILDAEVLMDAGPQSVGASKVDSELLITNLDQCVKFTPDSQNGVRVKRGDEDGQEKFQIDTSKCGNIDVDFRFCDHDDCRGGTAEGGIGLEPFEISNAKPDKTYDVIVTRKTVPGYYGVPVYARPAGGGWRQIAEYKVIVESDGFLDLDKYTFYTPPGESDSAILKNFKLREDVDVTADKCAWDEAVKDSSFIGAGLAVVVIGLLAIPVIGWIAAAVIAVIGIIVAIFGGSMFGEDCHDSDSTHTLMDYVINLNGVGDPHNAKYLPPDAQSILLDKEKLVGVMNLNIADCLQCDKKNPVQTVGVNFQNLGILDDKPTYSTATILTNIHHHGDPMHSTKGAVNCDNGNFGVYWVGPQMNQGACEGASDGQYTETLHLRFKTATEKLEIAKINFDAFACSAGVQLGVNGPGALPKTRLNWNWNGTGAINLDSCNADNPQGIYCDATQLNISIVKRLAVLEEFLKANNYQFTCPQVGDPGKATTQFNTDNALHNVNVESIGVSNVTGTQSGDDITVKATATNNGTAPADASLTVRVNGTSGTPKTCTIALAGVSNITGVNTKSGDCIINDLPDGIYTATAEVTSSTAPTIDSAAAAFAFVVNLKPQISELEQRTGCSTPRTTETSYGEPTINRFIRADTSVNWTALVPNMQALNKLTKFNALLIADGYSEDFLKDFGDYYSNVAFADADTSFHSLGTTPDGKKYGFNQFYLQNKLLFSRLYENGVNNIQAGVYEVELSPLFMNDWRFFDDQGGPKGRMAISFYRVADPVPNSMFYQLPLDGMVGLKKDRFDRQGYGVSFVNLNPTETVRIDNNPVALTSYPDAGSNPHAKIFTSIEKDIKTINTSPQFKGMVMRVENQGSNAVKLVMAPSYATPILLKMTEKAKSSEPFSAFYILSDQDVAINTGTSLTDWSGAGACLNFDGQIVTEAFFHKLDRASTQKDQLYNFQNAYAVDWAKTDYPGDVYLRSILYTPRHMNSILRVEEPKGGLSFLTADEFGQAVKLQGIGNMEHNRPGRAASDYINSVQDVFDLIKAGSLCMREEGTNVSVFWNPEYVYKQAGLRGSVHNFVQKLEANKTCIGYPVGTRPPASP